MYFFPTWCLCWNSIYPRGGQDTLDVVSWPPPTIPSQNLEFFILPPPPPPLKKNKNKNTSVFLIIRQRFYQLMMFLGTKQYISGWGQRYLDRGILAPTPYILVKNWREKMLKTHKNFCFPYYLTKVLPAYDVFKIKTVYIWLGPRYPGRSILAPIPYWPSSSQNLENNFAENM